MTGREIMKEIHSVQEKIYRKTKNLTAEEQTKYFNSSITKAEKKYGIKLKRAKDKVLV